MSLDNIDFIRDLSAQRAAAAPTGFKRYLYDRIDWRERLNMVKGARGTGKTTLMLQRMRETFFANQLRAAGHEITYPPAGDPSWMARTCSKWARSPPRTRSKRRTACAAASARKAAPPEPS